MAMAQATLSPALFLDRGHCPRQSGRVRRSVIRMSAVPSSRYRISGFGGASFGGMATFGQDFRSRATSSVNSRRRRTSRFVCRAMFARCSEKGIKAIICAHEEARLLGHNFVGTEQILLGLIGEGTSIAAEVLKSMGINIKDARVEVEKIIGRGGGFVAEEIPITPRAKRVMELALEEARQLGHKYIGAEHILLGLLREGEGEGVGARVLKNLGAEGVAARVLENLGADPSNIRTEVIRMVGEGGQ